MQLILTTILIVIITGKVYYKNLKYANIFYQFTNNIYMKNKKFKSNFIVKGLFGLAIGFVNGFFGGGGGMIAVPVMKKFMGLTTKQSHASAIFVILPLSIASTITYITTNTLNISNGLPIIISVIVGGVVGSFLLKNLRSKIIEFIFALVMIIAGIRLIF